MPKNNAFFNAFLVATSADVGGVKPVADLIEAVDGTTSHSIDRHKISSLESYLLDFIYLYNGNFKSVTDVFEQKLLNLCK